MYTPIAYPVTTALSICPTSAPPITDATKPVMPNVNRVRAMMSFGFIASYYKSDSGKWVTFSRARDPLTTHTPTHQRTTIHHTTTTPCRLPSIPPLPLPSRLLALTIPAHAHHARGIGRGGMEG